MKSKTVYKIAITLLTFAFLLLTSCSVQKQISKSANQLVLKDSSLTTAHVGISIYEPATNKYWYNYNGDHYFVPASNTKIPTCYAAMKYLGDSLVGMRYAIHNDTAIEVLATGDPTFLHPDFNSQAVFQFLKKFNLITLDLLFREEFLGSGWSWNDYNQAYMAQRSPFPIAGNVVTFKWLDKQSFSVNPGFFRNKTNDFWFHQTGGVDSQYLKGLTVDKPWDENSFLVRFGTQKSVIIPFTPDYGIISDILEDTLKNTVRVNPMVRLYRSVFHELKSQPTDSLLRPMMHRSDNFFAEQTLLMVSNELLGVMSDEKIIDTLLKTDFKDLPQKPRWADGSGLSRYNLFTPQDFVAIFNKMKTEFGMDRIKLIFPTGNEGTLSNYYQAESGYMFAKTGTLSGVVALSGFLYTKKNKLLIFSVLVNNHNATATAVRRAVEKFIESVRNNN